MKAGLTTSVVAHIGAFAFGVMSLSTPAPLSVAEVEALPIDIIPIESITKTIEGERKADPSPTPSVKPTTRPETVPDAQNVGDADNDKKADAPEPAPKPAVEKAEAPAAKPEPVAPTPKPTPVPTPEVAPKPEPKTDIAKLAEDAIEPAAEEPKEETFEKPERVVTPKQRPTRPQPQQAKTNDRKDEKKPTKQASKKSDKKANDEIAMLLNKEESSAGGAKRSDKKAGLGAKKGNNNAKMSQSELDALRGQIQQCWSVMGIAGLPGAEALRARVEFRLDRSGAIEGRPKATATGGDNRLNRTFAGGARRAVMSCAPYRLPADKYDTWSDVVVNFSLKDML
ncbi:hypothetical protein ACFQ14_02630 [Pseudahrensia aquimaris]|uniref:Cell division and transport-associated protein TolA n=1 Tax=Pseudahrensia aquimaris TaxID=744461 RepID=A0ABW3FA06_9HYPH